MSRCLNCRAEIPARFHPAQFCPESTCRADYEREEAALDAQEGTYKRLSGLTAQCVRHNRRGCSACWPDDERPAFRDRAADETFDTLIEAWARGRDPRGRGERV